MDLASNTVNAWAGQTIRHQSGTDGKRLNVSRQVNVKSTSSVAANTTRPTRVGAGATESATPEFYFRGDIAEVIVFATYVTETQRYLIKNYLSDKYGYVIASNDIYRQDDSANGNYDTDVAGIGRTGSTSLHNDAQGNGMVRVRNPQDLGDNEFMFWGHDNGVANFNTTSDLPNGTTGRFGRVWRVSELAGNGTTPVDVGAVDLRWDLTALGNIPADELMLLVDTDGDESFGDETPIVGASDRGDGFYQFSGVTALENGRRFTLARAEASLPVNLLYFDASPTAEGAVLLQWETASETDNA